MKKKVIVIYLTIFLLILLGGISYAVETGTVYLDTNKDAIENNEEVEITVNIKDAKTAAFNFFLYFDNSKLEYISKIENTKVEDNRILLVWHDTSGGKGAKQGEIAKLKFKAKQEGIASFSILGEFYNELGQLINTTFEAKQVQIGKEETILQQQSEEQGDSQDENNTKLQALRLNIEGMTPSFEGNHYEYYLTVPSDIKEIEVLSVSENPNANVKITGNNNLKEGLNTIKVQVTSENKKETKNYIINVTKTANLELANTNLETLAIENAVLNPPFGNNEITYNAVVSENVENLNILAIPQNESAKVQISGGTNLKEGNNIVTVIVIAPNMITKKTYQINVYKRNKEEENKYKEEQEELQEKLEEAYEAEKVSNKNEREDNTKEDIQSNKNETAIIIGTVIVVAITIEFWYFKYKKK